MQLSDQTNSSSPPHLEPTPPPILCIDLHQLPGVSFVPFPQKFTQLLQETFPAMAPTSKSTKTSQLRRNERERKRVHQVNDGFDKLRDCVTKACAKQKLSKADTLREAVKYIQHLRKLLEEEVPFSLAQNDYFSTNTSNTFPSPPSFYDESSYYPQAAGHLSPMNLTPPQIQPSPPNDYYLQHYPSLPQYQVMRTTP